MPSEAGAWPALFTNVFPVLEQAWHIVGAQAVFIGDGAQRLSQEDLVLSELCKFLWTVQVGPGAA